MLALNNYPSHPFRNILQAILIAFFLEVATQSARANPQITNQNPVQIPAQIPQSYILVTPKYPRPAFAPDVTFVLPYNFPYNTGNPGSAINLPPNQQFIQPYNQFPFQSPAPNLLPSQFPNQVNNLPSQYPISTPFPNPAPQNFNQIVPQSIQSAPQSPMVQNHPIRRN
jgi:hypothetical protein